MNISHKFLRQDIVEETELLRDNEEFDKIKDVRLRDATLAYDVELMKALLSLGANPNYQEPWRDSLLHWLAFEYSPNKILHGQQIVEAARMLLEAGANPNIIGSNNLMPINICKDSNARALEELLLEYGADPDGSEFI